MELEKIIIGLVTSLLFTGYYGRLDIDIIIYLVTVTYYVQPNLLVELALHLEIHFYKYYILLPNIPECNFVCLIVN